MDADYKDTDGKPESNVRLKMGENLSPSPEVLSISGTLRLL
jgi:hypothetical protein